NLWDLIFGFPVPIILAIMLYEMRSVAWKCVAQTILYLPHFLSWIIIGGLVNQLFSSTGMINNIIRSITGSNVNFLMDEGNWVVMYVATGIWQSAGWGTIANYLWGKQMHLIDSPWSLIWPVLISTCNVIIMRNFFASIPASLEESARLDGCNDFRILWSIVLPLSTASLATIALFYAVSRWNSFADVRYYINSTKYYTLQMKLYQVVFNSTDTQVAAVEGGKNAVLSETIKAAAIVFSTVPLIIVYPFLQKYFVQGVMIGAVKE
ncbi:MAG: ABC transporter permease subunit, partial [Aristaeellaceae bacterium]